MRVSCCLLVALLTAAAQTGAIPPELGSIAGHIVAAGQGRPVPDANILLGGTVFHAVTDSSGFFRMDGLRPGSYRLLASHVGFGTSETKVSVAPGREVTVQLELTSTPGRLDPIVVTATRAPSTGHRAPVTTHVVDPGRQGGGMQTAADLLRQLPGVDLAGGGSPGLVSGVSLRGAGFGQTLVLLDGVRLNTAARPSTLGGVDLGMFSVDRIDRIEVVKGAGSALYGSDAAGGVIHIFSRRLAAPCQTRLSAVAGGGQRVDTGGGYGIQRLNLYHGRRQGKWEWVLDGAITGTGGHLANTDARTFNGASRLARQHPDGQTRADLEVQRRRGGSPGAEGEGQFGAFDIDDRQNVDMVRLTLSQRRPLPGGWRLDGRASAQQMRILRRNPVVQAGERPGDFTARHRLLYLEPRLHLTRHLLRPLTVGMEYRHERQQDDLIGTRTLRVVGLSLHNRFEIGQQAVEFGTRFDHHDRYGSQLSPRLSAAVVMRPGLTAHAAVGRAFVPPNFDDLFRPPEIFAQPLGAITGETGNPELEPERAWSSEAGLRWHGRRGQGEAAVYGSRYRGLIQPRVVIAEIADSQQQLISAGNLARADITGLEITQRLHLTRATLQLAYTWQNAEGSDGTDRRRPLPGRLRQKLSGDLQVTIGAGADARGRELALRADWQERYFNPALLEWGEEDDMDDDEAAGIGAPDKAWRYLVLGANVRWRLSPSNTLFVDLANLTDARYQSVFGIPQPGLLVTAGWRLNVN